MSENDVNTANIKWMKEILNDIKKDIKEVKIQTTKTNGRVTTLEGFKRNIIFLVSSFLFIFGSISFVLIFAFNSYLEDMINIGITTALNDYEINITE